jgi:UMF1 family MFS transporter
MVPRNDRQPRLQQPQRALSSNSTKRSFRSHSSSFEADDERSSSADHEMGPGGASGFRDGPSQYAGEDTRLTSSKELSGWYAYGFAAEVFVICGIG